MKKSYGYVLLTALLFGSMEVALKIGGVTFDAIQLTFIRFFIGGLILLPFAIRDLKKRQVILTRGDLGYLFVLGFVCICISMLLFQVGVMNINANLAAMIISINPVFTMIFSHFLVNEKFTWKKALVLIISIIGLIIVMNPSKLMSGENNIWFVLVTLVAAISFGFYTAFGKKRIGKLGGLTLNSVSFLMGSGTLLLMLIATGGPIIQGISLETTPLLLYLGVFVTGIGYYFYVKIIEISGPSTASIAFFIKPVIAPVIAFFILREAITLNIVIGLVFILLGCTINLVQTDKLLSILNLNDLFIK
ncbi:MAG TPA: DMT family transporter [Acetobacterium sp.]